MARLLTGDLAAFLRASGAQPFVWGQCDCVLWAANWIWRCCGRDPGAQFRGRYATQEQCHRIVNDSGGLIALLRRELSAFGLAETNEPQPGDIVVVRVLQDSVCAIKTAHGAAFKTPNGIAMAKLPILAAWSV